MVSQRRLLQTGIRAVQAAGAREPSRKRHRKQSTASLRHLARAGSAASATGLFDPSAWHSKLGSPAKDSSCRLSGGRASRRAPPAGVDGGVGRCRGRGGGGFGAAGVSPFLSCCFARGASGVTLPCCWLPLARRSGGCGVASVLLLAASREAVLRLRR